MDADPQLHLFGVIETRRFCLSFCLNCEGTGDCLNDAGKLCQEAVAHDLEQTAGMTGNIGFDDVASQRAQPGQCIGLVGAYEAGIAHYISSEDCGQAPFNPFPGQNKPLKFRIPAYSIKACQAVVGLGLMSASGPSTDLSAGAG